MKKHIQIKDSYNIWKPSAMVKAIADMVPNCTKSPKAAFLIVEWWLHNIGYWVTLPFVSLAKIRSINVRCKHVDLMVDTKEGAEDEENHA